MADTKLTALSEFTPVSTDIIYGVDDPGGTPISGKILISALATLLFASPSMTGLITDTRAGIGATSTAGLLLTNTTAAAAGAQQWSPAIQLTGQGWKTNATAESQTVDWRIENVPVQGAANPTTNLTISSQVNAGGYTTRLTLKSGGQLVIAGNGAYDDEAIQFSTANAGIYAITSGARIIFQSSGSIPLGVVGNAVLVPSNGAYTFGNGTTTDTAASDTYLTRKAAASLQMGAADAASPVAQTLGVQSVVAGTTDTAGAAWTINGSQGTGTGAGGSIIMRTAPAGTTGSSQNALAARLTLTGPGSVVIGAAAIATDATDGFLYIPSCAGTPTGTPTAHTGMVPIVWDSTNDKLYVFDTSWKGGTSPGAFT